MTEGHFFEVTSDGELVWEYINPVTKEGIFEVLPDDWPMTNAVFRAYRYASTHPALANRTLTPLNTITNKIPDYYSPDDTNTDVSTVNTPKSMNVQPVYPNPFNPGTTISYELSHPEHVIISVYNIKGELVDMLNNELKTAGSYSVYWNATGLPSGAYFIRFRTDSFAKVMKCLYTK